MQRLPQGPVYNSQYGYVVEYMHPTRYSWVRLGVCATGEDARAVADAARKQMANRIRIVRELDI